jgi:hypothetical protein
VRVCMQQRGSSSSAAHKAITTHRQLITERCQMYQPRQARFLGIAAANVPVEQWNS